jgi:hypothetical protein
MKHKEAASTDLPERSCSECSNPAVFITPNGLLCGAHAVAQLADTDWIPVRKKPTEARPPTKPSD